MHKLFKKFGSLALVICTVGALATLPANAQSYIHTVIPVPELVDANGNTFTPALTVRGEMPVFDNVGMSGVVRTYTHTLSLQPVYALTRADVAYDDEVHSTDRAGCCEYLGILDVKDIYILNREPDNPEKIIHGAPVEIENTNEKELFSVSGRAMLSNSGFVQPDRYAYRFPSALGSFNWSANITPDDIMES